MKWLFFLLLLINIGLFVWIYPQQPPPQPEPIYLPGVKRLVLLSEAKQATHEAGALPDGLGRSHAQGLEAQVGKSIPPVQDLPPEVESATPAQDMPFASAAVGEAAIAVDPPSEVAAESPIQGATSPSAGFGSAIQPEQSARVVQPGPPRQCRRIGPLAKRSQADKLSLSLMAMGIRTELQTESSDEQDGYWVMIPPQQNAEAARAIVKKLREAGVSDLWRFTSGSLADGISLGLFRHESRAEIRLKEIAAKGFDAEVRPRYRQQNRYWLDFAFRVDSPLSEADWNRIAEIYPGLEQRSVDCAGVSSR